MLALALALPGGRPPLLPTGIPSSGVASWYGHRCPEGVTVLDRSNTCTPYRSKADGGKGGELWYYAAVGVWRYGQKPYRIRVCRADDATRCVVVWVRDYCARCAKDLVRTWTPKSRAIDLSPRAFASLAGLGRGVLAVKIQLVPSSSDSLLTQLPRDWK